MLEFFEARYIYFFVLILLGIGLFGMLFRRNLVHKIIGMTIFQTAIFLFFIEGSVREGGIAPVIDPEVGSNPESYVNPLPHLLILTAIVVAAGTLGVALALTIRVYRATGTLDEEDAARVLVLPDTAKTDAAVTDPEAEGTSHAPDDDLPDADDADGEGRA